MRWLRNVLRDWLREDEELSFYLDVWQYADNTRSIETVLITSSMGMQLRGTSVGKGGDLIVPLSNAVNRGHFWKLWRHFNPGVVLSWGDGEKLEV